MSTTTSLQKIAAGALTVSCAAALTFYGVKLSRTSSYSGVIHKLNVQHGDSPLSANYNVRTLIVPSLAAFNRSPDARAAFAAMRNELRDVPVLGIDAEWERGRPLALLQIASPSYCFIFQLRGWAEGECPAMVRELLEDAAIVKVGVGLRGDASRLLNEFGVKLAAQCDLSTLGHTLRLLPRKCRSLAAVTLATTGVVLGKDLRITLSAWETSLLSQEQVAYAADDAICAVQAFLKLHERALSATRQPFTTTPEEMLPLAGCHSMRTVEDPERQSLCSANSSHSESGPDLSALDNLTHDTPIAVFMEAMKEPMSQYKDPSGAPKGDADRPARGGREHRMQKIQLRNQGKKGLERAATRLARIQQNVVTDEAKLLSYGLPGQVRVFSASGQHVFNVDQAKAKWYVDKRQLATVRRRFEDREVEDVNKVGSSKDIAEIQLVFDPKLRTKPCISFTLGHCPAGDNCSFIHDDRFLQPTTAVDDVPMDDLIGDGQEVHELPFTASPPDVGCPLRPVKCATCGAVTELVKHSVVPPAFRKFLPPPFTTGAADDYFLICATCNQQMRVIYDLERNRFEEAMKAAGTYPTLFDLSKVVRHACLSSSETESTSKIPAARIAEMREHVLNNTEFVARHLSPEINLVPTEEEDQLALLRAVAALKTGDVHNKNIVDSIVHVPVDAVHFVRGYRSVIEREFAAADLPWREADAAANDVLSSREASPDSSAGTEGGASSSE